MQTSLLNFNISVNVTDALARFTGPLAMSPDEAKERLVKPYAGRFSEVMEHLSSGRIAPARALAEATGEANTDISYYSFEGYLNALVLLEALRRCGRDPDATWQTPFLG